MQRPAGTMLPEGDGEHIRATENTLMGRSRRKGMASQWDRALYERSLPTPGRSSRLPSYPNLPTSSLTARRGNDDPRSLVECGDQPSLGYDTVG